MVRRKTVERLETYDRLKWERYSAAVFAERKLFASSRSSRICEASVEQYGKTPLEIMERSERLFNYRFGLFGCDPHTLVDVGDEAQLAPERVRRMTDNIVKRCLKMATYHGVELPLLPGMYKTTFQRMMMEARNDLWEIGEDAPLS